MRPGADAAGEAYGWGRMANAPGLTPSRTRGSRLSTRFAQNSATGLAGAFRHLGDARHEKPGRRFPHFLSNSDAVQAGGMKKQLPLSAETDQTEALLQGLIAECHAMIRDQVRPAVDADEKAIDKLYMFRAAMELAKTGARIAETIGHLRGGQPAPEMRQRITVERIQTLPEKP